jgi:hypothetical protein
VAVAHRTCPRRSCVGQRPTFDDRHGATLSGF